MAPASECSHRTIAEWSALEAENHRLRERVASLEVYAITAARSLEAAGLAHGTDEQEAHRG